MADTVKFTLDGKVLEAAPGSLVIDAAKRAGIEIPAFCYYEGYSLQAACRMCLVEVEKMPKMQTACTLPVAEGMVVRSETAQVAEARKYTLEFLLTNHPLDCPVCDKGGECELQDMVFRYGAGESRYNEIKLHTPEKQFSPVVYFDAPRCILCFRCVRVCDEGMGVKALGVVNRGAFSEIAPNVGDHLECDECGMCIDICPVGALTSGAYRYQTRPWEMTHVGTICTHCSDGCKTTLGTRNDRIIRGNNRDHSGVNGEFLCVKGRYGFDFYDHAERLQAPLMRVGGNLEEVSWAVALGAVASTFTQTLADGGTFGVIGSNHTTNEENFYLQKFAREVLRTNNIDHHRTGDIVTLLDALSRDRHAADAATVAPAVLPPVGFPSLATVATVTPAVLPPVGFPSLATVATVTPAVLPPVGFPSLATIATVTPAVLPPVGFPSLATIADLYDRKAFLILGADLALEHPLLSFQIRANYRHHQAHVYVATANPVREDSYSTMSIRASGPAALEQLRDKLKSEPELVVLFDDSFKGADITKLVDFGNSLGIPVKYICLVDYSNSRGAVDMGVTPELLPGYKPSGQAGMRVDEMAAASLSALWVVGANPLKNGAPRKAGYLVVQDMFLTETAQQADVVLPAANAYEKNGTVTNVTGEVQRMKQAISTMGAKPDLEIMGFLAREMGVAAVLGPWVPDVVFAQIHKTVRGYAVPAPVLATGGAAQTMPVNGRIPVEARPDLVHSGHNGLFASGTLGRYSKILNSVLESRQR
jgi:NADH-quinone oxidoreductase subunit G